MNGADIYNAVSTLLYSKYPTYKVYGHEVVEGYEKPSFFIDLLPKKNLNESINFKTKAYKILITYFPEDLNEIDNLTKADEIIELFGYKLVVSGNKIPVTDSNYEFVGENTNTLQVVIEIEYLESNNRTNSSVIANELILKEKG
ncbi:hypothetical protein EDD66_105310 [Mobilisporobacter senegalensis]|uniref:Uncharacterized protein n=1 Tax=Mobilisporobacter senegalensis TaxID=1329262 RepID=A0A3N1XQ38_9FIRM|nr:hypothetical protein [Mobilisporobacter senegalensis]ROR28368.1 hypothetical protein EDD66_105310 [Mobilisporobacter senegalensis]